MNIITHLFYDSLGGLDKSQGIELAEYVEKALKRAYPEHSFDCHLHAYSGGKFTTADEDLDSDTVDDIERIKERVWEIYLENLNLCEILPEVTREQVENWQNIILSFDTDREVLRLKWSEETGYVVCGSGHRDKALGVGEFYCVLPATITDGARNSDKLWGEEACYATVRVEVKR